MPERDDTMLKLERCPKVSPVTGIRTVTPEETVRRALPLLEKAGMKPLEEITQLDNLGIPVFSVHRDMTAKGTFGNYNGKGATREQAMASAVMEALERYSAEQREDDDIVYGTFEQASANGLAVNPFELNLSPNIAQYAKGAEIAWVEGFEMFRGQPVWVPACEAFYPYYPDTDLQLTRFHTNGIASGNTMEEAILHALFELVERDAWSIAEFNEYSDADIEVDTEDSVSRRLLDQFEDNGIEIHLKDLTSDIGIPTIGAAADDEEVVSFGRTEGDHTVLGNRGLYQTLVIRQLEGYAVQLVQLIAACSGSKNRTQSRKHKGEQHQSCQKQCDASYKALSVFHRDLL